MMITPSTSSKLYDWTQLNYSELYQAAQAAGHQPLPQATPEQLVALLEGLQEPSDEYNPINDLRDAIMAFVLEYWVKLQSQLTCPAKSGDPKACYGCLDTQVVSCLVKNEAVRPFIQLKRKTPT